MKSNALPVRFYGDPFYVVADAEASDLGCRLCTKSRELLDRLICDDKRNSKQKGVPGIGHHCKFFEEKD